MEHTRINKENPVTKGVTYTLRAEEMELINSYVRVKNDPLEQMLKKTKSLKI